MCKKCRHKRNNLAQSVRLVTISTVCPFSATEGTKIILGEARLRISRKNFVIKTLLLLAKMKPSKRNIIYLKQSLLYRYATFIGLKKYSGFSLQIPDRTPLGRNM